jgi:hypothetical protein
MGPDHPLTIIIQTPRSTHDICPFARDASLYATDRRKDRPPQLALSSVTSCTTIAETKRNCGRCKVYTLQICLSKSNKKELPIARIELATFALQVQCSTTKLNRLFLFYFSFAFVFSSLLVFFAALFCLCLLFFSSHAHIRTFFIGNLPKKNSKRLDQTKLIVNEMACE